MLTWHECAAKLLAVGLRPDLLEWVPPNSGHPGYTYFDLIDDGLLTIEALIAQEVAQ